MDRNRVVGLSLAAGSGLLYGSINVLAKLVDEHAAVTAATMYLVSAAILLPWTLRLKLPARDVPKVLAMGLLGGGLAPILLLYGLQQTAAADAGLLLTLELVATATLAMLFLHERFARREVAGLGFLLVAAMAIALASGRGGQSTLTGALLVLGSAVAWGVDNAVSTRLVGTHHPAGLIGLKGLLGGTATLVFAIAVGASAPHGLDLVGLAGLGVASIVISSICFYFALRKVGASRTSAMNIATTGLVGAAGGAAILNEHLSWLHAAALACVGIGAWLLSQHQEPALASAVV